MGASVSREERPDSHVYEYRAAAAMAAALERVLPAREGVDYSFGALDLGTQPMEPAIRFLLVRHGDRVMAPGSFPRLGTYYELRRASRTSGSSTSATEPAPRPTCASSHGSPSAAPGARRS